MRTAAEAPQVNYMKAPRPPLLVGGLS
uniref:Uncharacterized protein n=1 Tax=Arundo donax TaxID=35708 RepID=A0A0A9F3W7_ARUDO